MQLLSEVVEFRDGTKVTVTEANWEADMRVGAMEKEVNIRIDKMVAESTAPLTESEVSYITFVQTFYPKLAACSTGDVPTEREAFDMPSAEREKWYAAVRRVNPLWFQALDAFIEKAEASEKAMKKKGTKPTASTTD